MERQKLHVCGLGFAFSLTWAIGILFVGLTSWLFSWGNAFVDVMGSVYVGYDATFVGTLIGTVYALVDGFVGGVLIAFFYNICPCCKKG